MNDLHKNLVLIGFMGSGKTSVGKWISENVNMAFYDTDEYIEKKQNREINQIFASEGEIYFRDLETETVKYMSKKLKNSVISVGGGLPLREENRVLLKKLGYVIYLRATEDSLVKRLDSDTKRPLLAGADLRSRIHELMLQREEIYESAADMIIDTDDKSFAQIYNEIEDIIFAAKNETERSALHGKKKPLDKKKKDLEQKKASGKKKDTEQKKALGKKKDLEQKKALGKKKDLEQN